MYSDVHDRSSNQCLTFSSRKRPPHCCWRIESSTSCVAESRGKIHCCVLFNYLRIPSGGIYADTVDWVFTDQCNGYFTRWNLSCMWPSRRRLSAFQIRQELLERSGFCRESVFGVEWVLMFVNLVKFKTNVAIVSFWRS